MRGLHAKKKGGRTLTYRTQVFRTTTGGTNHYTTTTITTQEMRIRRPYRCNRACKLKRCSILSICRLAQVREGKRRRSSPGLKNKTQRGETMYSKVYDVSYNNLLFHKNPLQYREIASAAAA